MASSSEAITISSLHDDEDDDDQHNHHGLSRLSICSTSNHSTLYDDDDDDGMGMLMSRLSMEDSKTGFESSDGDADGELSEDNKEKEEGEVTGDMSDSDKEFGFSGVWGFSNPSSPARRSRRDELKSREIDIRKCSSESEMKVGGLRRKRLRRRAGEKWLEKAWEMKKCRASLVMDDNNSGESEGLGRRRGSLCMDMDEVKACRDLGFELNHHGWMLDFPSRRVSGSAMDTSSGGNSPIANWRISSPGDDPRDVKARLKVWAQAVALASTAHLNY